MKSYILTFCTILACCFSSKAFAVCVFGDCDNGRGTWQDDNGGVYSGQFKAGMRHGNGIFMDNEGSVYVGSWKFGMMEGKGTARLSSGVKISGTWKNGKITGKGQYIYPNGEIYVGKIDYSLVQNQGILAIEVGNKGIGNPKYEAQKVFEKQRIENHLKITLNEIQNLVEESEENIEFYSPTLNAAMTQDSW